jgi:glutaredoxin
MLFAGDVFAEPTVELYSREGCPRCDEARSFLEGLARTRPDLEIIEKDVVHDREALRRFRELTEGAGITTPGVPAIVVGHEVIIGFDRATTPQRVRTLLAGGEISPGQGATCELETTACEELPRASPRIVDLPMVGRVSVDRLGLPLFTIVVGLIDGFNPCATWVLMFLLAMLVNLKDRSRMAVIAGAFVVVSGLVYFAFMAAWLSFFMVIGVSQPVRIVLAAVALLVGAVNVKDFFALHRGFSLSIPESAKPGIYARVRAVLRAENLAGAVAGIVALAFLVNLVELLCTAGLPAVYTAILTERTLPSWHYHAYLALYIAAYMLDDAILVTVAVATLGKRKLRERGGRWLKLVSGVVMLGLGALLLLRPAWLGFG